MRAYEFITEDEQLNEFFFFFFGYQVLLTNTPELKKSAMDRFEQEFGPVAQYMTKPDGSPSSVEWELRDVDWNKTAGIFDQRGKCVGALAMRPQYTLEEYLHEKPNPNFDKYSQTTTFQQLSAAQGEALVIDKDVPTEFKNKMLMLIARTFRNVDYLWGLAHESLQNMGFWVKHSIPLGLHGEDNVFVLPISQRAKEFFGRVKRLKPTTEQKSLNEYINNRIPNWDNLEPQELIKTIVDSTHDGRHLRSWINAVNNVWRGDSNNYTRNFLTAYDTIKNSIDPTERRQYADVLRYAHNNRINSDILRKYKQSLFKLPSSNNKRKVSEPQYYNSDTELMRNLNRRQSMLKALDGDNNDEDEDIQQRKSTAERILKWLPLTVYATVLAIMNDPERSKQYLKMPWLEISEKAQRGDPYAALLLVANRVRLGNISTDKDVDIPGGAS